MSNELVDTSSATSAPAVSAVVEYNTRDLLIYAVGIGSHDPRYVYENHPEFAAFPTYPIVLTYKGASFDVVSYPSEMEMVFPSPSLPGTRNVMDTTKYIEKINELPTNGAKMILTGRTIGVHQRGKNGLVEQEFMLVDEAGKEYYKFVGGYTYLGAKGFKDSGISYAKDVKPPAAPAAHIIEQATDEYQPHIYRLSGDYSPTTIDKDTAQKFGFEKPIMHGLCSMGIVARGLLDTFAGGASSRFKSINVRFSSPVIPGQTLVTEVWPEAPGKLIFQTKVKETGKLCVSNGYFELTPDSKL